MHNAPLPAGLPTQPHQGIGARFVRRLGRAARGVIATGIALAGRPRRPAASQPIRNPPAPRDPTTPPRPRRPNTPRQPRAAAPVPPSRPSWFARWFGRKRHRPVSRNRLLFPASDHTPFTPEAYPGLSPEACAFFNTPVEECDPAELRLVLAVLAQHIADSIPPELGMDAKALFSNLWTRFGPLPGEAPSDEAPSAEQPAPAPATPQDTVPDAPPAPPLRAEPAEPADNTATIATRQSTPHTASATEPVFRIGRAPFNGSLSFRYRCRSPVDRCRSRSRRRLPDGPHRLPLRRLCYAACAGPP